MGYAADAEARLRFICHVDLPGRPPTERQTLSLRYLEAMRHVAPTRVLPVAGAVLGGQIPRWAPYEDDFQRPVSGRPGVTNIVLGTREELETYWTAGMPSVAIVCAPGDVDGAAKYDIVIAAVGGILRRFVPPEDFQRWCEHGDDAFGGPPCGAGRKEKP